MKFAWLALGWLSVGIGGVGFVVPGLPSTVFFIAAAACFSRSSPRFERWVLELPTVGPMVDDYRRGLGMPARAKITAVTMMWVAIGVSSYVAPRWWIAAIIVAFGLIGSWFIILRTPTKVVEPNRPPT